MKSSILIKIFPFIFITWPHFYLYNLFNTFLVERIEDLFFGGLRAKLNFSTNPIISLLVLLLGNPLLLKMLLDGVGGKRTFG